MSLGREAGLEAEASSFAVDADTGRQRLREAAFWLGLLAISLFHGLDHLLWVAADGFPFLGGDSPLHLEAAAGLYWQWRTSPELLPPMGHQYYPPGLYFVALPFFLLFDVTTQTFLRVQALYTAGLALGSGLLARRCYGRQAGLAAGAASVVCAQVWLQRAETQLDLPLAGLTALTLATFPTPDRPGRPWRSAGAGLILAMALLTKQSMLLLAAGSLGFALPRALCAVVNASRRAQDPGTRTAWRAPSLSHLRDLAIYALVGLTLPAYWYLTSLDTFRHVLQRTLETHANPRGLEALSHQLGLLAWFKQGFLPAPVAWLLLPGVLLIPWAWRRVPLIVPVLGAMLLGLGQFSSFPDPHERHFLPVFPLALCLALLPVAWLRQSGRFLLFRQGVISALALLMMGWGLLFAWSWRLPALGPASARLVFGTPDFTGLEPTADLQTSWTTLIAWPNRLLLYAPVPRHATWPIRQLAQTALNAAGLPPKPRVRPARAHRGIWGGRHPVEGPPLPQGMGTRPAPGPQPRTPGLPDPRPPTGLTAREAFPRAEVWSVDRQLPSAGLKAEAALLGESRVVWLDFPLEALAERMASFRTANADNARLMVVYVVPEDGLPAPVEGRLKALGFEPVQTVPGRLEGSGAFQRLGIMRMNLKRP